MNNSTSKYRTKQESRILTNPKGKKFVIGLDIGYSAVKVFHEEGCFVFPSYARPAEGMFGLPDKKDILYRDDVTGKVFIVGFTAQEMVDSMDTNDSESELYTRKRYGSELFRIICDTALGFAVAHKHDNREICIQTGLPALYVENDSPALKKVLCREKNFSLKRGNGEWQSFSFTVDEGSVFVMPQPMGALYSVVTKNDGKYIPEAKQILTGSTLVLDIGFGTMDLFGIKNRAKAHLETTDAHGMRAVLASAASKIQKELGEDIRLASLQKNLSSGTVTCVDDENFESKEEPIAPFIESSSREIMESAVKKAAAMTQTFRGYQYLVIDGGTGEAWFEEIKKKLGGLKTLQIIPSNRNDHLPFVYSNARGYYMFRSRK